MNQPMPYGASERQRPSIPFLASSDLLPMPIGDGATLLAPETPIIRIPAQPETPPAIETRTAQRTPSRESDLIVPAGQAAVTAVVALLSVGALALALTWSWRVVAVAFGLALAASWLWRLRLADSLLWCVERLTEADVNRDGVIGAPQVRYTVANPAQARATVAQENRQAAESAERAELLAFVDKCFIAGCGEHAHGVKASGPDRAAFVAKRDVLMSIGVAAWKKEGNPKAGWQMVVSRHRARQLVEKHVL